MIGRSRVKSITFYMLDDNDNKRQSCAVITNKAVFSENTPVAGGLYDPHLGTTELAWKCQTCFNSKAKCPGHDGVAQMNYPLQSPFFRKDIIKWLRVICHQCGEIVVDKDIRGNDANRLVEMGKVVKASSSKKCACGYEQHEVVRDPKKPGVYYREYVQDEKPVREYIYNNEIAQIFSRVREETVIKLGKTMMSHPSKLIQSMIKVSPTTIRPEIRKIGGNRSTMSDTTAYLRTIMELNSSIPKELPKEVDADLHAKLVMIDLTFFEMIQGSSTSSSQLKLVTNTNKASNSIASRLPRKAGRLRENLMGKRVRKIMRSVITGDKALRMDQVGVPEMLAKTIYFPETVRPWNIDRLTVYFLNGPNKYPGCNKIKRVATGYEHYVENMRDYSLQMGDVVYRHLITGDMVGMNREPSLLYCSITTLQVKVIPGFTLRFNSSICALFNKVCVENSRLPCKLLNLLTRVNSVNFSHMYLPISNTICI